MFGNKKSKFEEQINELFSKVAEQRESFEASVAQIEEGGKRIYTDACQVMENTEELVNYAMTNIEEEVGVIHRLDGFSTEFKSALEEYKQIVSLVGEQFDATVALMEENKHYTTPSRYLTEVPAALKKSAVSCEKQLGDMAEYGKQMGVLALNAAIEAGRMGDSGKQFVAASEEIRQTALGYEKTALNLQEEVRASKEKIEELEDTIHHLISLIKESNMGTNRLLKKGQEISKAIQTSTMRDFSEDMLLVRDKVVGMRNLDEEVAKCGERNKIQLSDIQEDVQMQKNTLAELESDLSHLLDTAEEQLT